MYTAGTMHMLYKAYMHVPSQDSPLMLNRYNYNLFLILIPVSGNWHATGITYSKVSTLSQ